MINPENSLGINALRSGTYAAVCPNLIHYVLRASNGQKYIAIFDPGASFSCIHPKIAAEFPRMSSNTTVNASVPDRFAKSQVIQTLTCLIIWEGLRMSIPFVCLRI